jgi:hypothetical protein
MDTDKSELLVNNHFAYVSVSRTQYDAHLYTNDGSQFSRNLSRDSSQRTATEVEQQHSLIAECDHPINRLGRVHGLDVRLDQGTIATLEGIQPRLQRMSRSSIRNGSLSQSRPDTKNSANHLQSILGIMAAKTPWLIELLDKQVVRPRS